MHAYGKKGVSLRLVRQKEEKKLCMHIPLINHATIGE